MRRALKFTGPDSWTGPLTNVNATQIIGLSLNGLKDMGKNGIQHITHLTEKQREIVNGCLENASRAIVNRMAEKFAPFMAVKGPVQ